MKGAQEMFKKILIVTILILGITGAGFVFIFSRGIVYPEVPVQEEDIAVDIEIKPVAGRDILDLKKQNSGSGIEIANQRLQLENQRELLQKMRDEIDKQIENELNKIQNKYQERIAAKKVKLKQNLNEFRQKIMQQNKERIMVKKEFYQKEIKALIIRYEENKRKELASFQQEANQEVYNEILNLNLKLKLLDLTSDEKEKYQKRLKQLKSRQNNKLKAKTGAFEKEIEDKIAELEEKYDHMLNSFRQKLETESNQEIKTKKAELDNKFEKYISSQKDLMAEEVKERENELRKRSAKKLEKQQQLITRIKKEYRQMQAEAISRDDDEDMKVY